MRTIPSSNGTGEGITADRLNDDCLGRTLDWLYEHDVTTLFAGLASQARRRFGIRAQHLHIDTTSFSVSGNYALKEEGDPVPLAIMYGYSRDHREERTAMDVCDFQPTMMEMFRSHLETTGWQ